MPAGLHTVSGRRSVWLKRPRRESLNGTDHAMLSYRGPPASSRRSEAHVKRDPDPRTPSGSGPTTAKSPIGRLDQVLDEATRRGWTVVDMKQDWKVVYPFEKP